MSLFYIPETTVEKRKLLDEIIDRNKNIDMLYAVTLVEAIVKEYYETNK